DRQTKGVLTATSDPLAHREPVLVDRSMAVSEVFASGLLIALRNYRTLLAVAFLATIFASLGDEIWNVGDRLLDLGKVGDFGSALTFTAVGWAIGGLASSVAFLRMIAVCQRALDDSDVSTQGRLLGQRRWAVVQRLVPLSLVNEIFLLMFPSLLVMLLRAIVGWVRREVAVVADPVVGVGLVYARRRSGG